MAANVGLDFSVSAGGAVTIAGATHGLSTAALLVQVWDAQSPRHRLQPSRVTVDPTTFDVVLTFMQAQSGRVVLAGAQPATALTGHVHQAFAPATTWTIPASVHGFLTTDLLVTFTDAQAVPRAIQPGSVTLDPTTFAVVATFAQPQAGAAVVVGAGGVSAVPHVTQAFSAATSVTLDAAAAGLTITHLLVQVWDAQSPRQQVQPGSLTVDLSTHLVTATFLQPQSGTLVATGVAGAPAHALIGVDFSGGAGGVVTIPAATHGLTTADLLVQVWDAQTPRRRLQPGRLTVHPATFAVEASFTQAQSGRLVIAGAQPGRTQDGHYRETFASATTWTIPASAHGFATADLLVTAYDGQGSPHALTPGSLTVDPSTYEVVATFLQPQAGSLVIVGAAARSPVSHVSQAFGPTTSVTFDGDVVGLATTHLLLQIWDTQTPRQQIQPGMVTIDPSTHLVTVSFAQAQSGTLVATGVARAGLWVAAPLGSSLTSAVAVEMGGLISWVAAPLGNSLTPSVTVQMTGLYVLVAHPQSSSTTPAIVPTVHRLLVAHAQGVSLTPVVARALLRVMTAHPLGTSLTPAPARTLLRRLTGAVLGTSVTPASFIQLPGQITLVATVPGLSTTPTALVRTARQVAAAALGASTTPATVAQVLRPLIAHAQGVSVTPASTPALVRGLTAASIASSTTPVALRILVRMLTAHPQGTSVTPAAVHLLTRRLLATVSGASTTPAATRTMLRSVVAHAQGVSTTPVVNGLMGELRLMLAHPQGSSLTAVATRTTVRLLQSHPQGASSTPVVFSHMGMVLMAQVQGSSTTPAAVRLMLRRVLAHPLGTSLTPAARPTTQRPLLATPLGTSTTPVALRPSLLRQLTGAVAGLSLTPVTGSRVIRPLQAGILGASVTPVAAAINSNLNAFVAHPQASSTTPAVQRFLARGLVSQVLGSSTTASSVVQTVRPLSSHPQATSATSVPHGRIIRPLVSLVPGQSLTTLAGFVMARDLTAHSHGLSQAPALVVATVRLMTASVQGISVGLPGLLIPFSGQFLLKAQISGSSQVPAVGAMLLNMPRVVQVVVRPRVARVEAEPTQGRSSLVLTS